MRATRGDAARSVARRRAPPGARAARGAASASRFLARRRATPRARAPRALAEDGTARADVDAWLELYARDAPPAVFATFDARGTCTGVDYATNVATALRARRARGGDSVRTARVMAFRNRAMATREALRAEARRWREALGEGETPESNATRDAEDAAASGTAEVKVTTIERGDAREDETRVGVGVVSPFAEAAKEEDAGAVDDSPKLPLTMENVDEALDEVRPYLVADGGNVELVKIEDRIVVVRLNGACGTCASSSATMKGGIEKLLKQKFGDAVEEVVNVSGDLEEMTIETIEEHLEKLRKSITSYGGEVSVESLERGVCVLKFRGPQALAFSIAQAIKTKFPLVRECKIRQVK